MSAAAVWQLQLCGSCSIVLHSTPAWLTTLQPGSQHSAWLMLLCVRLILFVSGSYSLCHRLILYVSDSCRCVSGEDDPESYQAIVPFKPGEKFDFYKNAREEGDDDENA